MTRRYEKPVVTFRNAAEVARVDGIIERDRADRRDERFRQMAEMELRQGVFVNLADTVISPTPEWMEKGETRGFTPRLDGQGGRTPTVKTVRSVRRVITPIVRRMYEAGKLSDDHYAACRVYRDDWEAAGVEGRFKSSNFSLAGNVGGGGGMAQHPMAQHAAELDARRAFRAARAAVPQSLLVLLDKVVLDDVPLSRAWRFARCPRARIEHTFRIVAETLLRHYQVANREQRPDEDD